MRKKVHVPDLGHLSPGNRRQIDTFWLAGVRSGIAEPSASSAVNVGGGV
ncbi:hypothetical protein ABZV14_16880 [Streptosporangium canum]